ncbi:hypothetical protein GXW82_18180 [Streptacidiphilus sp. 4-A2]|nr:hypothetical protein [Streptacidiphilus sp. 4-A2]
MQQQRPEHPALVGHHPHPGLEPLLLADRQLGRGLELDEVLRVQQRPQLAGGHPAPGFRPQQPRAHRVQLQLLLGPVPAPDTDPGGVEHLFGP